MALFFRLPFKSATDKPVAVIFWLKHLPALAGVAVSIETPAVVVTTAVVVRAMEPASADTAIAAAAIFFVIEFVIVGLRWV